MAKKSTEEQQVEKKKVYFLQNLVIERMSLTGEALAVTMWERRRNQRGARSKLTISRYLDDFAAHPKDSVRNRAKRLSVDRKTIRRLEKERTSNHFFERSGPIVMVGDKAVRKVKPLQKSRKSKTAVKRKKTQVKSR